MTCIAAIIEDNKVIMGGDSCGSDDNSSMIVTNPKVFILENRFLLGVCGSFRVLDLLRYSFSVPKQTITDDDKFMRTVFIDALRKLLKDNDFPAEDDDMFELLVGYKGKLYCIQNDFAVLNAENWGHSVGTGAETARASLWTSYLMDYKNNDRVIMALQTSEKLVLNVKSPFTKLSL